MHPMPITAAGLLAHAVHAGLILLGFIGVVALLLPGWLESRRQRRAHAAGATSPAPHARHSARSPE